MSVIYRGTPLTEGEDYEVSGDFSAMDRGAYTLTIEGIGNYSGTADVVWNITCDHKYAQRDTKPASCTQTGSETYICSACGDTYTKELPMIDHKYEKEWTADEAATCTKEGSKSHYCTVCGAKGDVTAIEKAVHNYQETVTKATTKNDGEILKKCSVCGETVRTAVSCPKEMTLSQTKYTYNGKTRKPSVTVKDSQGKTLSNKTDYTVTYPKDRKNVGKYTVTINFKGNYSGTVKKTFTIQPKGTSLSKVSAKSKGFLAKWKKQKKQTSGYEIQYSLNSKFKNAKIVPVRKNGTVSKKITKLRAGKKYYVRIRTYKTVKVNNKSTKIYSDWSKVKTVKTN